MKKTTVYQDREARRQQNLERHTLACPHCGKPVLDHMTKCPHCGGELVPSGYVSDEKKLKKIRTVTYIIGGILSVVIIVLILVFRGRG